DRSLERPDSPAGCDAADADRRAVAKGGHKSLPCEGLHDSSHGVACLDDRNSPFFIQPDVFHIAYIDDNSPVDLGEICFQRMPSASGTNGDSVLTGPSDGVCYILRPLGKHKHFGKSVRMGIPILARTFIA